MGSSHIQSMKKTGSIRRVTKVKVKKVMMKKYSISLFSWFIILCSIYNTVQYILPFGNLEIKAFIIPFIGNVCLLFLWIIHHLIVKFFPRFISLVFSSSSIAIICLIFLFGLFSGISNNVFETTFFLVCASIL